MKPPETSTTLLRDLAASTENVRWAEFVTRYRPMMEAYMRERFPSVEADDVIQEAFLGVIKALPNYKYDPDEKGSFHNYLTGILRNKALCAVDAKCRALQIEERMKLAVGGESPSLHEQSYAEWRESLFQIALRQLMADETIQERTKQVFVRTAIKGESPEAVAESLGIPRNTVDKMKSRTMDALRELVERLKGVC